MEPSSHSHTLFKEQLEQTGGQSPRPGLQETQMQFLLVEIKTIFPQKCSSFCLEAVLGHSVSNWRVLEQAQACVLLSVQGCSGSQGTQKGMSSQPEQCVWLVSTQMPTQRHPVSFKMSLTILPGFQFPLQKCPSVLCHRISWAPYRYLCRYLGHLTAPVNAMHALV